MLKQRILLTLTFFDLQDLPLTLLELHRFLMRDEKETRELLDSQWEILEAERDMAEAEVRPEEVLACLARECQNETETYGGHYCLKGRREIIYRRLRDYEHGLRREKLVKWFLPALKHIPFVRGVAIGGSQALGCQKPSSDIDLLIVTDGRFLFLARTLVTAYFQLLGKRRHGRFVANRFCLNHYLGRPKTITQFRNPYTAMEYGRLRPAVYPQVISEYQDSNKNWIRQIFPNWQPALAPAEPASRPQWLLEKIFAGRFGLWLEAKLKNWQMKKFAKEKFIVILEDELSFHPDSKQEFLLSRFFKAQKQQQRVAEEPVL